MAHRAQVGSNVFSIDDTEVAFGRPVELFQEILGPWSRVFNGSRAAPTGYRNNIRYIYDDLGISLLDDWVDQCLAQVTFHFSIQRDLPYCPAKTWKDPLWFDGCQVDSDAFLRTVMQEKGVFRHVIGKIYTAEYGVYHATVDVAKHGHARNLRHAVVSVAISLKIDRR